MPDTFRVLKRACSQCNDDAVCSARAKCWMEWQDVSSDDLVKAQWHIRGVVPKATDDIESRPAGQAVIESREATHGDYSKQAYTANLLKNHFRDVRALNPAQQESLDMIAVKISRILHGNPNEPDHWTDIAGYATLISNLLTKGTHL